MTEFAKLDYEKIHEEFDNVMDMFPFREVSRAIEVLVANKLLPWEFNPIGGDDSLLSLSTEYSCRRCLRDLWDKGIQEFKEDVEEAAEPLTMGPHWIVEDQLFTALLNIYEGGYGVYIYFHPFFDGAY